jgi:hypothetical protein
MSSDYDFSIPPDYRGRVIDIPQGPPDWPKEFVTLSTRRNAHYLIVNPLEDEEEHSGDQGTSSRQQLTYFTENGDPIETQDLDNVVVTWRLMSRLKKIFQKLY